jgi:hypothetical protein
MIKMRAYIVLIVFALLLLSGCKGKIISEDNKVILDDDKANKPTNTIKESVNTIEPNQPKVNADVATKEKIIVNESPVVQDITINTTNNQKIKVNTTQNNQPTITSSTSTVGDNKPVAKDNPILDSCESEVGDDESCSNKIYGLNCMNQAEVSLADNTIKFTVKNNLNFDIIFVPSEPYVEMNPWDCMTNCVVLSTKISTDGIDFVDVKLNPKIVNNTEFYVKITCAELDKGFIDQYFPLSYNGEIVDTGVDDFFRIKALAK